MEKVSAEQICLMKHTIGLQRGKALKGIVRQVKQAVRENIKREKKAVRTVK